MNRKDQNKSDQESEADKQNSSQLNAYLSTVRNQQLPGEEEDIQKPAKPDGHSTQQAGRRHDESADSVKTSQSPEGGAKQGG